MAPRKVDFALAVRASITELAEVYDRLVELDGIYANSGYVAGGSNPIVDGDLTGHEITAGNLAAASNFVGQLQTFMAPFIEALDKFRNI